MSTYAEDPSASWLLSPRCQPVQEQYRASKQRSPPQTPYSPCSTIQPSAVSCWLLSPRLSRQSLLPNEMDNQFVRQEMTQDITSPNLEESRRTVSTMGCLADMELPDGSNTIVIDDVTMRSPDEGQLAHNWLLSPIKSAPVIPQDVQSTQHVGTAEDVNFDQRSRFPDETHMAQIVLMDIEDSSRTSDNVHQRILLSSSSLDETVAQLHTKLQEIDQKMTRCNEEVLSIKRFSEDRIAALSKDIRNMKLTDFTGGGVESCDSEESSKHIERKEQLEMIEERRGKDPSANYLKRCIREHVLLTFEFENSKVVPAAPSKELMDALISRVNQGLSLITPFYYDWSDRPTADYNRCVVEAFYRHFWSCAEGHQYSIASIPERYRSRPDFFELFRAHMTYLRKCWAKQKSSRGEEEDRMKAKQYSRNSRKMTTFKNRRNAASHIPAPEGAHVYDLVDAVGTAGVSSDEEVQSLPGHGRQYATFDKAWRAPALVHLYRYLDLIHASTRNPNGNPIRTRHRTLRVHQDQVPPKGLPIDCYDTLYLNRCTRLERHLLAGRPSVGLDDLWNRVQALGLSF